MGTFLWDMLDLLVGMKQFIAFIEMRCSNFLVGKLNLKQIN